MKIYDKLLLDVCLIIMPFLIYLIYNAYNKIINKEENKLIFNLIIISDIYLILKYGKTIYENIPLFTINIPLLISYKRNNKKLIITLSVICILYYYSFYNSHLLMIISEYLIYYLIYKKMKEKILINIFSILKPISIVLLSKSFSLNVISGGIAIYLITKLTIFMFKKSKEMLNYHIEYKKIKKESQIKKSLFQITHEIKNPIAVCKGYLDMYDPNKIVKFQKNIPIIKEEIDRTLILLEDFLEMNTQKINKDIIDINYLLEEVTKNMSLLFKEKNIKLETHIPEEELYINADYNRLTQVFINIFKNSIEALENKKIKKIIIWTKIIENKIIINIKDNGVGISKEIISKIKEPFYTTKQKGTGLGVSLSEEIIKAHGGTMNYKSEINNYTLVSVGIPIEKI